MQLQIKAGNARKRPAAVRVAYRGPSLIDGTPVRAVVCALERSLNPKTGAMVQVLISPDDEPPHEAVKSGRDRAACGDCVHRPQNNGSCYVVPNYGLLGPWYATMSVDADLSAACSAITASGLPLRIGSWGDPAAVPFEVTEALVRAAAKNGRARHTAYSNQWRTCDQRLREIAMASVISEEERAEAHAMGWRTFRIRVPDQPLLEGERVCPASYEAGKQTTCSKCLACSGSSTHTDIVVQAHGCANKVARLHALVNLRRAS